MLSLDYSVLNANAYAVPQNFLNRVSELALKQSINKNLDWQTISHYLQQAITEEWSELKNLGNKIIRILESETGYVVVKNLPYGDYERPQIDYIFASLALCLGCLTVHNSSNNTIWDVTHRSDSCGRERTFSELNIEAPFHNDSAFRILPEKYFGLWAIKAARDGGNSTAIHVRQLVEYLEKSSSGQKCLDILRFYNFPFRVPPAFAANPDEPKVIEAPILAQSPLIRFRLDTIMKGFQQRPELATPERLWAVKYFDRIVRTYPDKLEFKLNDGEVVFFNNHTMLHGRTAFSDRQRLLLRIRIDGGGCSLTKSISNRRVDQ